MSANVSGPPNATIHFTRPDLGVRREVPMAGVAVQQQHNGAVAHERRLLQRARLGHVQPVRPIGQLARVQVERDVGVRTVRRRDEAAVQIVEGRHGDGDGGQRGENADGQQSSCGDQKSERVKNARTQFDSVECVECTRIGGKFVVSVCRQKKNLFD